jgi:tyrosyl-tRNA synthetase
VELIRRVDHKPAFGLTTPLLSTASGAKMGKTAQGAVWLNADMRSPYDYWQFWRNAEDADVGRFLRLFTDLPLDEIARLEALDGAAINDAKKVLADSPPPCCTARTRRRRRGTPPRRPSSRAPCRMTCRRWKSRRPSLAAGIQLAALAVEAGLAGSNGEARRLAQGGGLRLNDTQEMDANREITATTSSTA